MNREELKKEAQEQVNYCTPLYPECFIQGYLAGAEPREERIVELERKLEQTEKDLADYQFNYPTIKDLEKKNAELEADNDARKYAMAMSEKVEKQLREENAKLESDFRICEKNADTYYDQRTKAKELLNEFMRISKASDEDFEHDYSELIGEQFLEKVK